MSEVKKSNSHNTAAFYAFTHTETKTCHYCQSLLFDLKAAHTF